MVFAIRGPRPRGLEGAEWMRIGLRNADCD